MKKYIIEEGDTLSHLAIKFKTTIKALMDANPYIVNRDLIYTGKTLLVPDTEYTKLKEKKEDDFKADLFNEEFVLFINNKKTMMPIELTISTAINSISSVFKATYPMEIIDESFRKLLNPIGLYKIDFFVNKKKFFSGEIEEFSNALTKDNAVMSIGGRTKNRILEKSTYPRTLPREFSKRNINTIAEAVVGKFGIPFKAVENGRVINQIKVDNNENCFDFLQRLATTQNLYITYLEDGTITFMKKEFTGEPVFDFVIDKNYIDFAGVENINVNYNTVDFAGTYYFKQHKKDMVTDTGGADIFKITDNFSSDEIDTVTVKKSQLFDELSFKEVDADGNLAAESYENNILQNMLNFKIPYPSLYNKNTGLVWKIGEVVTLTSPALLINNKMKFYISAVEFKIQHDRQETILDLVPVKIEKNTWG